MTWISTLALVDILNRCIDIWDMLTTNGIKKRRSPERDIVNLLIVIIFKEAQYCQFRLI
jgi:hypothetical protein